MNTDQLTMLLARIQVLDNRQVDELTIQAWTPLMESIDYKAAVEAVNAHAMESTEYLKPAHIVARVREAAKVRAIEPTRKSEYMRWVDCTDEGRKHVWCKDGSCAVCEQRAF